MKPAEKELREHKAFVENDSDFSAFARLLQSKWREEKEFPIGKYKQPYQDNGKRKYREQILGNLIKKEYAFTKDKTNGKRPNFLTANITEVVDYALKNKEKGAKIEKNRLFCNLLSSQPMAFNLFAELSLDKKLATTVFNKIYPEKVKNVEKIVFEHSDGRGDLEYTGDHSAFDVFIEYKTKNEQNGFIGIEVKYAENLKDKPSTHKSRYQELSINTGIFRQNSFEALKSKPIQQIWRDHLLSIAHLKHKNKKYQEGFFVYLFPEKNTECEEAVKKYREQLITTDEEKTGFYILHLEKFVDIIINTKPLDWIHIFKKRYIGHE
jgi:hypothetical protein